MNRSSKRTSKFSSRKLALIDILLEDEGMGAVPTRAIPRRQAAKHYPLSFAQERLWFLEQLHPDSPLYNMPTALRVSGSLDAAALARSLSAVVRRHEALRTTFAIVADQPVQIIAPALAAPISLLDLRCLPPIARETVALRLAEEEAQRPFDLERGPLLRALLLRLTAQEHVLLLNMHHIVGDEWALGVLVRDITAFYVAYILGQPAHLPELAIQYADYAVWQRERLQGKVLADQLDYWREQLAQLPALQLPTDHLRPATPSLHGTRHSFALTPVLSEHLAALSRREGVTMFMLMLAAFQVLLARHSGQDDIAVGTPIANRTFKETEDLIGCFVNTLVLRVRLGGHPTFQAALQHVREVALAAYAHQELPFEQIVEALHPARDLSYHPLFQVAFALQNAPKAPSELPILTLRPLPLRQSTAKFDLSLAFVEAGTELAGIFDYRTALFEAPTIIRLARQLETLLSAIVADSTRRLADLPLLTAAERQQVLVEWNATAHTYPHQACLHHLFEAQAARTPDAVAILFDGATNDERGPTEACLLPIQHLTYSELERRANHLAHHLRALGVEPEVRVGICVERSVEAVVGLLGILKAGGAYVPLDPSYPAERLSFMLEDAELPIVLTRQPLSSRLPAHDAHIVFLDAGWMATAQPGTEAPDHGARPDHLAYLIYTSGTTGRPKAVMVEHRGVVNTLCASQAVYQFTAQDRVPCLLSFSFDITLFECMSPLLVGGVSILVSEEHLLDLSRWSQLLPEITFLHGPPSLLRQIVGVAEAAERRARYGRLRQIAVGGDVIPVELLRDMQHVFPNARVHVGYGPTEGTIMATNIRTPRDALPQIHVIGRPMRNMQVFLCDARQRLVPLGVPGELYIGGVGVARGYLGRPDLTAERFVPNPFMTNDEGRTTNDETAPSSFVVRPSSRLYRTGDLARYLPDGNLVFLGRLDGQVKVRGYRIELGEIETILGRHPAVRGCVVAAREAAPGDLRLAAYVVPSNDVRCPEGAQTNDESESSPFVIGRSSFVAELRAFLTEKLPNYMIPASFILLDALPLTSHGKVDRRALPEPDARQAVQEHTFVAPSTPLEALLASIWMDVLSQEQIGVHDNFFALGGHSLLATQVIARMRTALSIELPLRALFEGPTIAALAERVAIAQQAAAGLSTPPLLPVERTQPLPLSFAQQRLWFLDQLAPASSLYTLPLALQIDGPLNLHALWHSLAALLRRHEVLRTSVGLIAREPVQVIAPAMAIPLPLLDLRLLPRSAAHTLARRLATEESRRPFDLTHGPVLRAAVLRLAVDEHVVLLTIHHIAADGWSMSVLIRDLTALYAAATGGQPAALPDLPVQYADYALWQQAWLQGSVLEAELAYWKAQLADLPTLQLLTDYPRPAIPSFRGASHPFMLPADVSANLITLSRREGVTLFMTLLAGFQVLLARYSSQGDIVVGTPIANRTHDELKDLIGFFINTLVLRTDLTADSSFRALLGRVRAVCLDAYAHQDLPFEKLVEELQPARDLSRPPLFQVMFVLQNTPQEWVRLPELTFRLVEVDPATSKFDLTLAFIETPAGLVGGLEYSTDLFTAATITRLARHLTTLLTAIATDPARRLAELPLLSAAERHQLLVEWNATSASYPLDSSFHQLFERQTARTPDAIALVFREQRLSYGQLDQRANRIAHYLRSLGVGPEVLVAICLQRSLEIVVAILGVLKAGGAYVPLDPSYPAERLAFMFEDSRAHLLVTSDQRPTTNERIAAGCRLPTDKTGQPLTLSPCHLVNLEANWPAIAEQPGTPLDNGAAPDNLAYVIYTSGSTGVPKGVPVSHGGLSNLARMMLQSFQVNQQSHVLQIASFSFDASFWDLLLALPSGASLTIVPDEARAPGVELAQLLDAHAITNASLTPSMLASLPAGSYPALRTLITTGEACTPDIVARWAPGRRFLNGYGPTEVTVGATIGACADMSQRPTIGRPFTNTQIYLLDRQLQPIPIGVPGELYIGGVGLARGYLNHPELTAERFIPNPFAEVSGAGYRVLGTEPSDTRYLTPDTRLYRTGDLACYRADGTLDFLGRLDQQVKIRGFRVELGEIEAVLSLHPGVRESVVLAREDRPGERWLVAYVVQGSGVRGQGSVNTASNSLIPDPRSLIPDLRRFLAARLPDHMVPAIFVLLEALPLTAHGKVDRRALPAPDLRHMQRDVPLVAPRTAIEDLLASIWAGLLHRDPIGVNDNFFALGGHSLLATQLIARVREAFQVELPLRALFMAPTIAELAEQIAIARRDIQNPMAPPLRAIPRTGPQPLSFAQQRLWVLDQIETNSPTYNLPNAIRMSGAIDIGALGQSLSTVVRRHETLRTTFAVLDGQPVQVIAPPRPLALPVLDLEMLPTALREQLAQQLARADAHLPFDLARDPLLRATLLRLADQDYVLLLNMHHIVADGWSMVVLIREITTLYNAYLTGQSPKLPELPVQYADYAVWQREWLQGTVLETQLAYWLRSLAALPVLQLPTDRPRPARPAFEGASRSFAIPQRLHDRLMALSQAEGVTLFMILLAAFHVLLARYSGQEDIAVGTDVAGRTRPEIEPLIGFFVNQLVLRGDLRGNPTFQALLRQTRVRALDAYTHQDLPFEQLVKELNPERTLAYSPLFQVKITMQHVPPAAEATAGLKLRPLHDDSSLARFDLVLALTDDTHRLIGSLEYRTDLFDATTIARLARHYEALLEGIVVAPARRLAELSILTPAEHQQLLVEWNTTEVATSSERVHERFAAQAARTPDAVALALADAQLTYGELNVRANRLAHELRQLGVRPEVRVGLCVERSLDMLIGLMGILKAGGAYVPLDPDYPSARLAYMIEDSQIAVLLTQARLMDRLPNIWMPIVSLNDDRSMIAPACAEDPDKLAQADNLAYMIYTSGSTGAPKGALVTHSGLSNLVAAQAVAFGVRPECRVLQFASLSFDAASWELFMALAAGATLCLLSPAARLPGPDLHRYLSIQSITTVTLPPSALAPLPATPLPVLETLIVAGEACPADLAAYWSQGRRFFNAYGPTETTVCATIARASDGAHSPPIGRPIANTQVYVLDAHMRPAPIGIPGELYIGGAGLARGYFKRADLTAERFIPNPFVLLEDQRRTTNDESNHLVTLSPCHLVTQAGERLYRTGDLARYLPDGEIKYLGRIDQQIKLRGYRIEPGEIAALLRSHAAVREAAVLAREDTLGEPRLVAYVVPVEGTADRGQGPVDTASDSLISDSRSLMPELREFLAERLPAYMLPAAFVILDALPLTANDKLDRAALPAPEQQRTVAPDMFVAPRNPTEELLAGIWADVLRLPEVGATDHFFMLGGHSLLGAQVIARIYDVFGVELPLRRLFETPTVAELAVQIEAARQSGSDLQAPPLRPVPRTGSLPLSFAQQRLWFIDQLQPNSSAYNIPTAVRLLASLDRTALAQGLSAIAARHEVLRTTYPLVDGQPIQLIAPAGPVPLPLVDLHDLPQTQREAMALQLAIAEARTPFDLARGPLLRATLLWLAPEDYVLLMTMNHIISDGWSAGIFVRELTTLYSAYAAGQPVELPRLPIQYADYALWQRAWLQGAALEAQQAYWRTQLADLPTLDLPTDRPRPLVPTFAGARMGIELSRALSEALAALSRRAGTTIFMTLLAAWQVLLARYSGQNDIAVGAPITGRTRAEAEGLIGCFINTLVLRTDLSGNPSFFELLRRVREVCLEAYTHQELPFEQVVEAVQPLRDLSRNPLFQVLFMLQHAPVGALELPGMALRPLVIERETAQFDLTLSLEETPAGLVGSLEYQTDLFDSPTAARMLKHFRKLLESIVAAPGLYLADLPFLTDAERQHVLVEWNATATPGPHDHCVHHLFEAQAARTSDAVAVAYNNNHLSYRALDKRAGGLAQYLGSLGIETEMCIGLYLERSLEMIVGLLGILKVGAVYVPLDPAYPAERLRFMLLDAQVSIVLTQRRLLASLPESTARYIALDDGWKHDVDVVPDCTNAAVTPENLAYVIYTSGSTGQPKGVMAHHHGVVNFTHALVQQIGLSPAERFLQFASLSFDASALQIFPTLLSGATLVVHSDPTRLSNYELLELCRRQMITTLDLPAAFWRQWVVDLAERQLCLPPSVQVCLTGGEVISQTQLKAWADLAARPIHFLSSYGPTEATVTTTVFGTTSDRAAHLTRPLVPLGSRLTNTQLYLLDRSMQPVPIGVAGELYIGGAGLARGYLGRPDLTAERFVPNPFGHCGLEIGDYNLQFPISSLLSLIGMRLYKTGDMARYRQDGSIDFLGRRDWQVKLRGVRIELNEIAAVLQQHVAVQQCVVIMREDVTPASGYPDKRLIAYVVPALDEAQMPKDEKLTSSLVVRHASLMSELRTFLKERLPSSMIPAAFVVLDELPLTANGKLNVQLLPPPDPDNAKAGTTSLAPRDSVEFALTRVWEDILGIQPIGVADNFFDLGGHSLLAVSLIARIRQQFGHDLPLAALFRGPTIEQLAALLRRRADALPWSPLVEIRPGGSKPPFFCVHPVGGTVLCYAALARQMGPDRPFYGLEARGLYSGQTPFSRLEHMAACYAAAIRAVQPQGPYFLGGWSVGGIIAFEIAQQLCQQGQEVGLLALLDTMAPVSDKLFAAMEDGKLLAQLIGKEKLPIPYDAFLQLAPEEQITCAMGAAKKANELPADISAVDVQRFLGVWKSTLLALSNYAPRMYPNRITLFKTELPAEELEQSSLPHNLQLPDSTLGWSAFSPQPIAVHTIPGTHETMIYEPHVHILAEKLRSCLI